ncbi:MAG: hypothetical protein HW383_305 [Candidatus Magasanikbacteria bacterium]|nr:hypothetical protein [Candidatus Magasanikbacteria bacterium]
MVAYLGAFLVYSSFALGHPERLRGSIFIIALYSFFDLLWTYLRERVWYLPTSSWISGLILSLVAIPAPSFFLIFLLPFLAVASKHLLYFGKTRHIFNPAAFAMGALAFFTPTISWWGASWGNTPLIIIAAAAIFILWRQDRLSVAVPFLISYAIFLAAFFLWNGLPFTELFMNLRPLIIDGAIIFFATVILIEPVTSSFPTGGARIFYGALVGFFSVVLSYVGQISVMREWPIMIGDPLIYGLLLGNLLCSLLFLKSKPKLVSNNP